MTRDGSITQWFSSLQAGDRSAVQELWQHFAGRLIGLARERLRTAPRRAADEEDAVLSAFDSFCRGAEQGRYPLLQDRNDLWNLLVAITVRKVSDQIRLEKRQKRGGGAVRCEADLDREGDQALDAIIGADPTPELAVEVAEQCQRLLEMLPDADLRSIALWKMERYTNEEIAAKLDCARSTVQRKLNLIQARWEQELPAPRHDA
ncbi:MAG: RNA polymerase subunit sigma-70 [Planctomycetes bacterium]|nr:RNA polymerase subunit sigma-70 [Planctomycetota bacterium]